VQIGAGRYLASRSQLCKPVTIGHGILVEPSEDVWVLRCAVEGAHHGVDDRHKVWSQPVKDFRHRDRRPPRHAFSARALAARTCRKSASSIESSPMRPRGSAPEASSTCCIASRRRVAGPAFSLNSGMTSLRQSRRLRRSAARQSRLHRVRDLNEGRILYRANS